MKITQIEKLNQLVSRTDMTGNEKVEWLTNFIDEHVTEQLRLNDVSNRIMALPLEKKHELLSVFFSNTKVVRKGSNEAIDFLKNQRRIVLNDELEKHGYLGSEMLAIKKTLSLVYGC